MKKLLILPLFVLLAGCLETLPVNSGDLTEGHNSIQIDQRLMAECPKFEGKLQTGSDAEVVQWSEQVLKQYSECRKTHSALVGEVKKLTESKQSGK